jgi:hypothetical protein
MSRKWSPTGTTVARDPVRLTCARCANSQIIEGKGVGRRRGEAERNAVRGRGDVQPASRFAAQASTNANRASSSWMLPLRSMGSEPASHLTTGADILTVRRRITWLAAARPIVAVRG